MEKNRKKRRTRSAVKFNPEEEEMGERGREEGFEGVKVGSRVSAVEQVPRVGPRATSNGEATKGRHGRRNVVSNAGHEARAKSNETAACTAAACSI